MTTPKKDTPKRTAVTRNTDFAEWIVPHWLDIPAELEEPAEELRAAVVALDEAHAAHGRASKAHNNAQMRDRIAAAEASPGQPPAPSEPELRRELQSAEAAQRAALDAAALAKRRQMRAITPAIAAKWREDHDARMRAAAGEIVDALDVLLEKIVARDVVLELDHALERVERGQGWRMAAGAPGHERRQVVRRADKLIAAWEDNGMKVPMVPNDPIHLVAALSVDAAHWERHRDQELAHIQRGQIVAEVEELGLPDLQRSEEIRRRCDEAGIPWRR